MRELNRLIPAALNAVRSHLLEDGKVASEYNGYISSFGATIKQCGLPITVVMFDGSSGSEKNKKPLLDAIWDVVKADGGGTPDNKVEFIKYVKEYNAYGTNPTGDPLVQYRVERAAIALKLAIRTFPQSKR